MRAPFLEKSLPARLPSLLELRTSPPHRCLTGQPGLRRGFVFAPPMATGVPQPSLSSSRPGPQRPYPLPEVPPPAPCRSTQDSPPPAVLATNLISHEYVAGHRDAACLKRLASTHGVRRVRGLRQRVPRTAGDVEWAAGARELGAAVPC